MKMTLTEGLALLTAATIGIALTLTSLAAPPTPAQSDTARQALGRLAASAVAVPDHEEEEDGKGETLLLIARSQLKLGDNAGALATLRLIDGLAVPQPSKAEAKPGTKPNLHAWTRLAVIAESVDLRRKAGDANDAQQALTRAARYFEKLDHGTIRGALEKMDDAVDSAFAEHKNDIDVDEELSMAFETSLELIDLSIQIGDMPLARKLIHRTIDDCGTEYGTMKSLVIGKLGAYLVNAGEPEAGRALIERSRKATIAFTNPESHALAMEELAESIFQAGDLDQALALIQKMTPPSQQRAWTGILDSLASDDRHDPDLNEAGILCGYMLMGPKDPAATRAVIAKILTAARASADLHAQARILSTVAYMQAKCSDFTDALATARSIPNVKWTPRPAPDRGFHQACKPITFALIAGMLSKAGDQPGAIAALEEAEALARTLEADNEKLFAQVAIAAKNTDCGRPARARAIASEMIPLALAQPEPRRSRVLSMFARVQVQAGDGATATRTIDAIRDYPGIEKASAVLALARWQDEQGQTAASNALLHCTVACLEAKPPKTLLPGKTKGSFNDGGFTLDDLDLELGPNLVAHFRKKSLESVRLRLRDDTESAALAAKALPPAERDAALSQIAGNRANRGDIAGAMELTKSIESPDARLTAITTVSLAILDQQMRK